MSSQGQQLPGGDLYLPAAMTGNYSCVVRSPQGVDSIVYRVQALGPPAPTLLTLAYASAHALNLTIHAPNDGGAPHPYSVGVECGSHVATIPCPNFDVYCLISL